jgi:hypothetical protein
VTEYLMRERECEGSIRRIYKCEGHPLQAKDFHLRLIHVKNLRSVIAIYLSETLFEAE